jgi:multiple sugar transport system permease protein
MANEMTSGALRGWADRHFDILMIMPALIVLLAMVGGPLVYTIGLSFTEWKISSVKGPEFAGIVNFIKIFQDAYFYEALWVTFYFTFGSLFFQIILGVMLAEFLNRKFKGIGLVRSVLVLPMASTPVAISILWRLMLHPTLGILNYFLARLGIAIQPWLSQQHTVLPALIVVDVWHWTPLIMLIAMAGMATIDRTLYEAGVIDGASGLQLFWHITLPLIRPAVVVAAMLRLMDSLKTFDMIYVVTNGGPGNASRILNLLVFDQGFRYFQMGYASSLVIFMTVLMMGLTLALIRIRRARGQ